MLDLFTSLPRNNSQRIEFLREDYLGIVFFDINALYVFFVSITFALFMIFLSYSLGKKISLIFHFQTKNNYDYLLFIAFGYILIGSGIAFLGLFSILNFVSIGLFLALLTIYSLFPFSLKENAIRLATHIKSDLKHLASNKFVFVWTLLFIAVALVNLINPEVREDQYHVDLPVMYLEENTIMIPPLEGIKVSASPLLGEMFYIPAVLYLSKETARYIHFIFYILIIFTLINFSRLKKYKFAIYTPILFASAPVVIHETSSMYVDFQWIFSFLLSTIILIESRNNAFAITKSGLLFGGMIAAKLWTTPFSIVPLLYLLTSDGKIKKRIKEVILFFSGAIIVSSIWLMRAYVLTQNPLYPAFRSSDDSGISSLKSLSYFVGINYELLDIFSFVNVFSLLFFISFVFLLYKIKISIKTILQLKLFKYLFFLLILYLLIHYPFGRYLLGLYVIIIFLSSFALNNVYQKFNWIRIFLNFGLILVFSYYFINSILILPYSFEISDKNKYLSRILVRDNSSYYDFGYMFDKHISQTDKVAMYNFHGYYYANFKYKDINFIYDSTHESLNLLKEKGYTKLLIRSGDIKWFCSQMKFKECDTSHFYLVSKYLEYPTYYLYKINYD